MTVHAVKDPDFLLAWFFSFHSFTDSKLPSPDLLSSP